MNTVTLSTGKVLTEEELNEVREIIRFEDDKEDIEDCLSSGYFEDEEWYMDVPEDAISEIAGRKAELGRQKDMSWTAAADRAIEEWMRAHSSFVAKENGYAEISASAKR